MKFVGKYLISAAVFLIFFCWATSGNILLPFSVSFPVLHLLLIFFLMLYYAVSVKYGFKEIDLNFGKSPFFILPAAALILSLLVSFLFLQGMPHVQDSINYLVMAENFAAGKLHSKMPDHYEFFQYAYMIPDGEKLYSLFLPGFSFFLVPFVILGIPVLANPILTALNVFLTGKITEKLFDRKIAVVSMFFMLFSTFFIVMGGTWMAHPFCMTMTLLAVWAYIHMVEYRSFKYPIMLGVSLGWLALTRPQNTLFVGIPLIAHYALVLVKKRDLHFFVEALEKGLMSLVFFAPFLVFLLYYNSIYTGDPLLFKQDIFFNYSEPRKFCHRFGLGTGCSYSNGIELPPEGLTFTHALFVSSHRLSSLMMNLFLHPMILIMLPLAFVFAKNKSELNKLFFLFSVFFVNLAGYFFFYYHGNAFGPRYLYETSFFLIVILSYAFCRVTEGAFESRKLNKAAKILMLSMFSATLVYQTFFTLPALKGSYDKGFWNVSADLKKALDAEGVKEGVVFVAPFTMYGSGYALMDHGHFENNKIIYVRDLGIKQNRRVMFEYPEKKYYWARFKEFLNNTEPPEIHEIFAPKDTGEIHLDLENKSFPLTGNPDFCQMFPEMSYLDPYLDMEPPYQYLLKYQTLWFCRFTNTEQYYDFKQKVTRGGDYEIRVYGLQGKEMGNFDLLIDGQKAATLDFHADEKKMNSISLHTRLDKGMHDFRIVPRELVSQHNYFMIDYFDFVPRKLD